MCANKIQRFAKIVIGCFWLSLMAGTGWCQVTDTMSVEELFTEARTRAFDGQTEQARILLKEALHRAPDYTDVRLFLGRTYAWDGDYPEARKVYQHILGKHPNHQRTWQALAQVEWWGQRYQQVLTVTDRALEKFPRDTELLFTRAQALIALERFDEARRAKAQLAEIDPSHEKLSILRNQLLDETQRNVISWSGNGDFFSKYFDAGYETRLQYERKADWGSVIGRINIASRFDQQGVQPEVDLYPKLGNRMYAYLNYGYSTSDLYPQHRIGGELFRSTKKGLEYSLGARYLQFDGGDKVTVITASGSTYLNNWWISIRPFFSPFAKSPSGSLTLLGRRYVGDDGDYVAAELVVGASYDQRLIQLSDNTLNEEVYLLDNRKMALEWLHQVNQQLSIKLRAELGQQELSFKPDSYVGIYSFRGAVYYRF
jgi:YaiO family outer membrane protein